MYLFFLPRPKLYLDLHPEMKSGYPNYPKSGLIRTILETEIRSLKTGKPVLGFLVGRALF